MYNTTRSMEIALEWKDWTKCSTYESLEWMMNETDHGKMKFVQINSWWSCKDFLAFGTGLLKSKVLEVEVKKVFFEFLKQFWNVQSFPRNGERLKRPGKLSGLYKELKIWDSFCKVKESIVVFQKVGNIASPKVLDICVYVFCCAACYKHNRKLR